MSLALFICANCGETQVDPQISTPQNTVETLLKASHLWDLTQVPLFGPGPRLSASRRRPPVDLDQIVLCFWDYDRDDPGSRAMGEFVAGMLAASYRNLSYRIGDDRAMATSGRRPIFFIRSGQGWHIELRRSVPDEIRQGLKSGQYKRLDRWGDRPK